MPSSHPFFYSTSSVLAINWRDLQKFQPRLLSVNFNKVIHIGETGMIIDVVGKKNNPVQGNLAEKKIDYKFT